MDPLLLLPFHVVRRVGNYSCLKVDLMFTRDRSFYFTTVFIPGIILVTSSFITFWLEWNAVPARVMIGEFSLKLSLHCHSRTSSSLVPDSVAELIRLLSLCRARINN